MPIPARIRRRIVAVPASPMPNVSGGLARLVRKLGRGGNEPLRLKRKMDSELTKEETGWLALMRYNQLAPRTEIRKKWSVGRLSVSFHWRSRKNLMGRFGGGWNWELGFQASSWRSIILNLLICNLWFRWEKAK